MGGARVNVENEYQGLSSRAQVERLRVCAREVCARYPWRVARLRLLSHGYNTIFRVDTTDGRRFALRLNVGARKTLADLEVELRWLAALAADTSLTVPEPQPALDGGLAGEVWCPSLERSLPTAVFSWLPGRELYHHDSDRPAHALGGAMAVLHAHAATFRVPRRATLPSTRSMLLGLPDHLSGPHPLLTRRVRTVVEEARQRIEPHYAALFDAGPTHLLHGDLHGGNAKWYRGQLSVFDFDDVVIGAPAYDLAVSTYYLRAKPGLEEALFHGYAARRPLPQFDDDTFEAVVAGRNLLLLDELLGTESADFRAQLPTYVANTVLKQRRFLRTGVFRHDVKGVVPLW